MNPVGLAPEAVQGGAGLQNGRAVMVVSGLLRNVTASRRPAAPLRVALFDAGGRRVASQLVIPLGGPIAPGDVRAFQATFVDPPLNAVEFGVDFDFDAHAHAPPARGPAHAPVRAALKPAPSTPAAAVADAHALPADSPYALPSPHG